MDICRNCSNREGCVSPCSLLKRELRKITTYQKHILIGGVNQVEFIEGKERVNKRRSISKVGGLSQKNKTEEDVYYRQNIWRRRKKKEEREFGFNDYYLDDPFYKRKVKCGKKGVVEKET